MKKYIILTLALLLVFSFGLNASANNKAIFNINFGDSPNEVKKKVRNNIKLIAGDKYKIISGTEIEKVKFYYRNDKLYKVKRIKEIPKNATKKQAGYMLQNRFKTLKFMNGEPDEFENFYKWELEKETYILKVVDNKIITINKYDL